LKQIEEKYFTANSIHFYFYFFSAYTHAVHSVLCRTASYIQFATITHQFVRLAWKRFPRNCLPQHLLLFMMRMIWRMSKTNIPRERNKQQTDV